MKAWTQERFSHEGKHYSFQEVALVPRPYQSPHPPIRVAVASSATFSLMGKRGFPIFCTTAAGIDELETRFGEYRKAYREAGHPGEGNTTLRMPVHVAETDDSARSEAGRASCSASAGPPRTWPRWPPARSWPRG